MSHAQRDPGHMLLQGEVAEPACEAPSLVKGRTMLALRQILVKICRH